MRLVPLCLLGLLLPLGCVAPEAGDTETEAALVNGTAAQNKSIGILNGCTAVVIGAHTALTAAHCFGKPGQPKNEVPLRTLKLQNHTFNELDHVPHPDYASNVDKDFSDVDLLPGDLAVVLFLETISTTGSLPLADHAPDPGDEIALWGYGVTGASSTDFGVLRRGLAHLARVDPLVLVSYGAQGGVGERASAVCYGDSGGPTLVGAPGHETVVGIHSTTGHSAYGTCGQESWDMRVDVYRDWIEEAAATLVASYVL